MSGPARRSPKSKRLVVAAKHGISADRQTANLALDPAVTSTVTSALFAQGTLGELAITDLCAATNEAMAAVKGGDMAGPEALLTSQAFSLNMIFTELARRAAVNLGEHLGATESYMRLALKAQAQCRATVETLATMKSPPVIFARQANIAAGPQQVNNGQVLRARAGETERGQNELLGGHDDGGERLDGGATGAAIGCDSPMEPLATIDRAAHG